MSARIPYEKIEKILEARTLKMSVAEAAAYAGVKGSTVSRRWKAAGLEPHNPQPRRLTEAQIETILVAQRQGFSKTKLAALVGISTHSVTNCLRKKGIELDYEYVPAITDKQKALIFEAHNRDMSMKETAEFAATTVQTVRKYWRQKGLKSLYSRSERINDRQKELIIAAHGLGLSAEDAGIFSGTSNGTVLRHWQKNGLTPHNVRPAGLTEEQVKKIYAAHDIKMSLRETAAYAGTTVGTVGNYWLNKGIEAHYKDQKEFWMDFGYGPLCFDSYPERIVGIVLADVGLIDRFEEGRNLHVKVNCRRQNSIDFLVDDIFIEYHPLSKKDKSKGLTLEAAGERKRASITRPKYKGFDFHHIWTFGQLYDLLLDEKLNALLPEQERSMTKADFEAHIELAHECAAGYDENNRAEIPETDAEI